jgi:hypothetical protein
MTLKLLYSVWCRALAIAFIFSIVYVSASTWFYVRNPANDGDFAALPYILNAHGIVIFVTGTLTAFWLSRRQAHKQLVTLLLAFHILGALIVYPLSYLFPIISVIIFMNPLAFMVFAHVPYICWAIVKHEKNMKVLINITVLAVVFIMMTSWYIYLLLSAERPTSN